MGIEQLTPRELEVAKRVGQGKSAQQIGAELFVHAKTIKWHLTSIYRKLDLHDRVALAAYMIRCEPCVHCGRKETDPRLPLGDVHSFSDCV